MGLITLTVMRISVGLVLVVEWTMLCGVLGGFNGVEDGLYFVV